MTKELREMDYGQLVEYSKAVMKELRRKAYAEGYAQGRSDAEMEYRYEPTEDITYWSPQHQRDRIVEQAKKDVDELKHEDDGLYTIKPYYACYAEFIINKDKRTVVALLRGRDSRKVRARGIAKCAPCDCFNVHIGKAIALRRALGLEVPYEYLNAPQPTEVRVGDVVKSKGGTVNKVVKLTENHMYYPDGYCNSIGLVERGYSKIIDDSREEVSE